MFIFVLIIIAAAFGLYSLFQRPSQRAVEIFNAHGDTPDRMSDRDRAYVADFYRRFGGNEFRLSAIEDRKLDGDLAERYAVQSGRLDDRTVLGVRLPHLKLLNSFEPGRYQLTRDGIAVAESVLKNENRGEA
ncbi:MAG: hypothetical protein WA989_06250 [Henriciella sp.]|uniref:hypothetical protein n=1 Tax=Henriciella sp. TaxID=1968823 RepID=UPI003C77D428